MGEVQRDCNSTFNVGGELYYMNAVEGGGGELTRYDATPVGSSPVGNYCDDVRSEKTWSVRMRVVGDNQTARDAIYSKFKEGGEFTVADPPSGSSQMYISGRPEDVGAVYKITAKVPAHTFQQNSELSFTLTEMTPPASSSGGSD